MATITKRELAIRITDKLHKQDLEVSQQMVLELVQCFIDEVTDCLTEGHHVVMRNFGAFQIRQMKEKVGRNPKNPAKDVKIPARTVVKFKPGRLMKEKVSAASDASAQKAKGKAKPAAKKAKG